MIDVYVEIILTPGFGSECIHYRVVFLSRSLFRVPSLIATSQISFLFFSLFKTFILLHQKDFITFTGWSLCSAYMHFMLNLNFVMILFEISFTIHY